MKTLLWLDDIRNPFVGTWLLEYAPEYYYEKETTNTVWVKDYDGFVDWIDDNGLPTVIGFDHDLGGDTQREKVANGMSKRQSRKERRGTPTGMDCAKWLVEYCINNEKQIPNFFIQSANPVGSENIRGLLNNAKKHLSI